MQRSLLRKHLGGIAVDCGAGGEDGPLHTRPASGLEQNGGPLHVDIEAILRLIHGLRHRDESRLVEDHVHAAHSFGHFGGVAQIAFDEFNFIYKVGEVLAPARGKVIQHFYFRALIEQGADDVRADKARAACH